MPLQKMTTLADSITYFTEEDHILASLSVTFGDGHHKKTVRGGVRTPGGEAVEQNTVYDVASLSKLFTCLTVLRLYEAGKIDLNAPVTRYAPQFIHLGSMTVEETLGFCKSLQTAGRVDAQKDRASALQTLFTATPVENSGLRAYSDMHAMVLKYIIEGAAGERVFDAVRRQLLLPLGMSNTWAALPEKEKARTADFNGEHRLEKGQWIIHNDVPIGTPHDPKARRLSPHGEDFCGHAGIFSCEEDMVRLAQGILNGQVVSSETLDRMAVNRTGCLLPSGEYRHFLGYQCYLHHPQQHFSEVPTYMGSKAFALSGFTGQHLSIDPERKLFTMFLGNRVQNRLSVCVPENGKTLRDYGLNNNGTGRVLSPDGYVYSSVQYVYQKDARLHDLIAREL